MVAAGGRREEAEGRGAAAEVVLTTTGARSGLRRRVRLRQAGGGTSTRGEAAGEERRARDRLVRAKQALEVAQKEGERAEVHAVDADKALAGIFGAAGLLAGQSPLSRTHVGA